ncbi:hypothetical protein P7C71_g3886, partial [Lecanoromycetidae sp. Uapishka_2]
MHLARLASSGALLTFVLGHAGPAARGNVHARQDDGYYGDGGGNFFTFLPPPAPSASIAKPTSVSQSGILTGVPSGTGSETLSQSTFSAGSGTISQVASISAPFGNSSLSQSASSTSVGGSGTTHETTSLPGTISDPFKSPRIPVPTVYSSISLIYTVYRDPNVTRSPPSGKPTLSSNATTIGSISGLPSASRRPTDPGSNGTFSGFLTFSYPSHGPYPFPSSRHHQTVSGTSGTGVSQSATGSHNYTRTKDPSTGSFYPSHGPYTFPTGTGYQFTTSKAGTIGTFPTNPSTGGSSNKSASTVAGSTDSGISPSTTIGTAISTTGTAIYQSATSISNPSGGPTCSENSTISSSPSLSQVATSTFDPSASGTLSVSTGVTSTFTGTGYSSTLTEVPTTFGTSTTFTYTPTTKIQPSEYYHHHRRPHHHHKDEEGGHDSFDGYGFD